MSFQTHSKAAAARFCSPVSIMNQINALEWHKRWYSTGAVIENYIAEDIERSEKK